MVGGLHTLIWNRTKKPLVIALSGTRKWWGGETVGMMWPMYNTSLLDIVTIIPPEQQLLLINNRIKLKNNGWHCKKLENTS
jgi:hypothetical protein